VALSLLSSNAARMSVVNRNPQGRRPPVRAGVVPATQREKSMRVLFAVVVVVGVLAAATGGFVLSRAVGDPRPTISPVVLDGLAAPTTLVGAGASGGTVQSGAVEAGSLSTLTTLVGAPVSMSTSTTRPPVQQVQGLYQLVGVLRQGNDVDDWSVSGVDVDFGPKGWIATAGPIEDYDGDGRAEQFLEELRGLRGRQVTLAVSFEAGDELDDAQAYTINGRPFRDPLGGPAPWQVRPAGAEATREQVIAAAVAAAGPGSVAFDLDRDTSDGWVRWEVDVHAPNGRDYEVYVDVAGMVLDIRPEDDDLFHRAVDRIGSLTS